MSKKVEDLLPEVRHAVTLSRSTKQEVSVSYHDAWGHEVVDVHSKRFRMWLTQWAKKKYDVVLSKGDCETIATVLEAEATYDTTAPERDVFTRVAWYAPDQTLYVSLADTWQHVVCIKPNCAPDIQQQGDVPVAFYRSDSARPLPLPRKPEHGETLDTLLQAVLPPNVTADQRILILAWLVGSLHPTGPYPVLGVAGQPGSGKSSVCVRLKRIVDPNVPDLNHAVGTVRDLIVVCRHHYVLAYDNLSKLSKAQSDRLCRLATGGGEARRSLFTNQDLQAFEAKRPVLLNCVANVVTEGDLLDRSIQLHLGALEIKPGDPGELELLATFESRLPEILWELYRVVGVALANMGTQHTASARMQTFARFVAAAEPALGWKPGTFLAAYEANRQEALSQAVTASLPVQGFLWWMQRRELARRTGGSPVAWHGTAAELQRAVERAIPNHTKLTREAQWPKKPHIFVRELHTAAPALTSLGLRLRVETMGKDRHHETYIESVGTKWMTFKTFVGKALDEDKAA